MELEICPDLILAGIAVFGAAAFFFLYRAITLNPMGRRRRRRDSNPPPGSLILDGNSRSRRNVFKQISFLLQFRFLFGAKIFMLCPPFCIYRQFPVGH